MRRYRFTLESALRARRAQEDVARQRLAGANHRLAQARAAHQAAIDAARAVTLSTGVLDREDFVSARAHELRLADAVVRAQRTAVEIEVEAAVCYAAWVESGKRVASLERLDERRREEYQAEVLREEATAVDDVVASRWSVTAADGVRL